MQNIGDYRFTERSKKVIKIASEESEKMGHNYLGTEHIILGILKDGDGLGVAVLQHLNCDLDYEKAKKLISELLGERR